MNLDLAYETRAALGEGPVWDNRRRVLYWLDIENRTVHIFDPSTQMNRRISTEQRVGCLAPTASGDLLLGMEKGFGRLNIESGEVRPLLDPECHLPSNRFNDGKCDPAGRFWAGTMSMQKEKGAGSLYCLFPDMTFRTMISGVTTSNGMAWSGDQTAFYYIDTPTLKVAAFDYNPETADISRRRNIIAIPQEQGKPDGMTIDEEDMLWIAHYGGGRVTRWEPATGKLIATLELPVPNVTSCTFGGLHLDELYITTARQGLTEEELTEHPKSGSLFRAAVGVKGTPAPVFAG